MAILIGPALAERLRIPGLVGLIFVGMVCGPYVLGWMRPNGLVAAVGAAGLLYLMFQAGLELDLATFADNKTAAVSFGLLTFLIPGTLSFVLGLEVLDYPVITAALLAAMWASHTIVAYPEIKLAGLDANRAVGASVASTVITDLLSLVILAVTASSASLADEPGTRASHQDALLPLWLGLVVLVVFTLWILPRLARVAFTRIGQSRTQRFIIAMAAMSAGAVVALLGGIEGLVGAFLAGIGVNRLVPSRGALMERIEFFGASLFVPAFLVSVGLSIDPSSMFEWSTIRLALLFCVVVFVGKALAAAIAGKIVGFSYAEIGVMASLTMGQAAATLAISQVGVEVGIFDQQVLNAAVLTLVIMVFVTSLGTRHFAAKVEAPEVVREPIGAHVLAMAPADDHGEAEIGVAVAAADGGIVSPFIVTRTPPGEEDLARLDAMVERVTALGQDSEGIVRIGAGAGEEIRDLIVEHRASLLLVPWRGLDRSSILAPASLLDEIGRASPIPVAAAALRGREWERVIVETGSIRSTFTGRQDALLAVTIGKRLAGRKETVLEVYTSEGDLDLEAGEAEIVEHADGTYPYADTLGRTDLVVAPVHVARGAGGLGLRRLQRIFAETSLLIVAGPHRFRLTRAQPARIGLGIGAERDMERYLRGAPPNS